MKESQLWLTLSYLCIGVMGYIVIFHSSDMAHEKKTSERLMWCGTYYTSPRYQAYEYASIALAGYPKDSVLLYEMVDNGHSLFMNNCQQCHSVERKIVGPPLKGVFERRNPTWLVNFIKNPEKMIDSGDTTAQSLYQEYKQYMPNHDFLSDEEILSILFYVDIKGAVETNQVQTALQMIYPKVEYNLESWAIVDGQLQKVE